MNAPSKDSDYTSLFDVADYGAIPDGKTNNSASLQRALDACGAAGGGTVFVRPGVYLTTPIQIRSNTVLHLAAGARILGSPRLEDYPVESGGSAGGESVRSGLVTARNAENVAITGHGEIDGNGIAFHHTDRIHLGGGGDKACTRQKDDFENPRFGTEDHPFAHDERPGNLVRIFNCRRVKLEGVIISNSPTWTINFRDTDDIEIAGVTIHSNTSNQRVPNDDGIDLANCERVRVHGCLIDTGDDCIALFGSRDVIMTNCNLRSRSAAVRIGYDAGETRNCIFSNLTIEAHRGFTVITRGPGTVESIHISNIVMRTRLMTGGWWGRGEPLQISAMAENEGVKVGHIRGVHVSNLTSDSESGVVIHGSGESIIEDISFTDVRLRLRGGPLQKSSGGNFDLRGRVPLQKMVFKHDIPALFFTHVRKLRIDRLDVTWGGDLPDFFSHAIEGSDFEDVEIAGFRGRQAHVGSEVAAISLERGVDVSVHDSRAVQGCGVFLGLNDVKGFGEFANNDTRAARVPADPELPHEM